MQDVTNYEWFSASVPSLPSLTSSAARLLVVVVVAVDDENY